tara:strand:+ start:228 stop:563 length:336 start_codon:yes stop_codon:yes gene_type:complete
MSEEWYNMVRATDPQTSKTAAKEEVGRVRKAKDRVMELIIDVGGISGMTDEELAYQDGVITSKYRTARVWLERQHYIGAVGQRKSRHGKYQRVWFATEKGKVLYCKIKESK